MSKERRKRKPSKTQRKKIGGEGPLIGTLSITRKGTGYFSHPDFKEDVEISPDNLNTGLHKDTVEIELNRSKRGKRRSGKVMRVVERNTKEIVGTLRYEKDKLILEPDDRRIYTNVLIKQNKGQKIDVNTKALVELSLWTKPQELPQGAVIEIIGKKGLHETEMRSIVLSHGFKTDFKQQIEKEAHEIERNKKIKESEIQKRRDMRDVVTFTIDPADAKDFDDAISIKRLPNNLVEVGIHIADVSHYVRPGSAIDKEARHRATSIYLVDRTIPMLPEILSNDVCSLNPNEDKLTYSAVFILNPNGDVKERWFGKTVIHSNKRFTYEEAQKILDTGKGTYSDELALSNKISERLRKKRLAHGSIDFDQDEIAFELDKNGKPTAIKKKERLATNKLIEDFMLLANQEVATHFNELCKGLSPKHATFIYRIHDAPNSEKIEELGIFLRAIGHDFKVEEGEVSALKLNNLFRKIAGTPEENLIKKAVLQSMSKAVYSTKNIGHFGLSFAYYTQFTSPIRRYPDIMVHRILKNHLGDEPLEKKELDQYEALALQSSRREVEAMQAERDSIKLKQVEYMKEHIGESFEGTITGVTDWGIYVEEKETKSEGMLRLSSLQGDYYELDKKNYRVVGNRTKRKYTLGDTLCVRLIAANVEEKTLEWALTPERQSG